MNYKLLVDTAMLAGEIMMRGGAETYRVEDTMVRILKTSGLETTETYVTPTGIFLSLGDPGIDTITLLCRVENRDTNISNIYKTNNISRAFCSGCISLEEAYQSLNEIKDFKQYSDGVTYICIILASLAFTVLLGGDWLECVLAGFNGIFIVLTFILTKRFRTNTFIKNMVASAFIALSSMFLLYGLKWNIQLDTLIGGSVMPLLPGVAITNAIRDTLQGDYVSGGARAIEAFVSAASTAAGIGVGMAAYSFLAGGVVF